MIQLRHNNTSRILCAGQRTQIHRLFGSYVVIHKFKLGLNFNLLLDILCRFFSENGVPTALVEKLEIP